MVKEQVKVEKCRKIENNTYKTNLNLVSKLEKNLKKKVSGKKKPPKGEIFVRKKLCNSLIVSDRMITIGC